MLYPRMKELLEKELNIKVLGYVPKMDDCVIESRHLGLVLPDEIPELKKTFTDWLRFWKKLWILMQSCSLQKVHENYLRKNLG